MHFTAPQTLGAILVVAAVGSIGTASYLRDSDTEGEVPILAAESETGEPSGEPESEMPVATDPLAATALRAGLSPEALAAAGVTAAQIPTVLADFETEHEADSDALATADAAYASERVEVDRLRRLIRARKGSPEDVQSNVTSLGTCMTARDSAKADRDARLGELFDAAVDSLTAGQVDLLETYQANDEQWTFPAQYMVVERSEEDWVRLRECLGNEIKAPEIGDALDSACQTWLATVRADSTVATAATNLTANGVAVRYAWNLHFSD